MPNLLEGTNYPLTRLSRDYNLMNSLYRGSWIIRKVIDSIPEDALKNWYELNSQITPEAIDQFKKVEKRTKTKAKILEAWKWGRLYGGAAAVMMIEGHEDMLSEPLDLDSVMPDSYKGLLVLDRWSGITPSGEYIEDINDPDFGLPQHYQITTRFNSAYNIHSSRVLRFIGRDLPYWEKQAEIMWGMSEVEVVFDELKKRDNTSWNIAHLIFLANIRVLKQAQLAQMLSTGNSAVQQKLFDTLSAQNQIMSNMGMLVLNKDDDYEQHQISAFTGLSDVLNTFMLDMCGATEIPATRLFGRSPAGLNSTGDSDDRNYIDSLEKKRTSQVDPQIEKLLPVMAMSTWGQVPDDLDITWAPIMTVTADKLAELAKGKAESIVSVYNSGLISQKIGMQELKQQADETNMFSNITDEDIAAADAEVKTKGELPGLLPGFGAGPDKPEESIK